MFNLVTGGALLMVLGALAGCGGSSSTEGTVTTGGIHEAPTKAGHSYNGSEETVEGEAGRAEDASAGTGFRSGYELCDLHGMP